MPNQPPPDLRNRVVTLRRALTLHGRATRFAPGWESVLESIGIARGRDWTRLSPGKPVRTSARVKVFCAPAAGKANVYFKLYSCGSPGLRFGYPIPSKAVVEAFGLETCRELGIPAARAVAVGEDRSFGLLRSAFIVTREVEKSVDLAHFARERFGRLPAPELKRLYLEVAGQLLEQLKLAHSAGFFHRDLKWRNILLQRHNGRTTPVWIDCPRAAIVKRPRRARVEELSALARMAQSFLTPHERMRFLRSYLTRDAPWREVRELYVEVGRHLKGRQPRREGAPGASAAPQG